MRQITLIVFLLGTMMFMGCSAESGKEKIHLNFDVNEISQITAITQLLDEPPRKIEVPQKNWETLIKQLNEMELTIAEKIDETERKLGWQYKFEIISKNKDTFQISLREDNVIFQNESYKIMNDSPNNLLFLFEE